MSNKKKILILLFFLFRSNLFSGAVCSSPKEQVVREPTIVQICKRDVILHMQEEDNVYILPHKYVYDYLLIEFDGFTIVITVSRRFAKVWKINYLLDDSLDSSNEILVKLFPGNEWIGYNIRVCFRSDGRLSCKKITTT
jgi:hypothetical protein